MKWTLPTIRGTKEKNGKDKYTKEPEEKRRFAAIPKAERTSYQGAAGSA
jgi:hypothetical protein